MKNLKHHGRRLLGSVFELLTSIIAILSAWKSAIPDLFALPPHAFQTGNGINRAFNCFVLYFAPGFPVWWWR